MSTDHEHTEHVLMICAHEFRTRHEHTEYVLMPEQGGHARLVAQSPRCLRRPGARLVVQSPRSHPFRGAPPLKGCGTPSRVRHPFRGAAPLEGRRTPDAAPQGVRAAACGKPLQSSSGSRGSAGRGFLFVVSLFFVVFCVMGKSNFAGSCFLEVRRVRI